MINPKQLLYAETASQMIKHSVKPNENGKRLKKLGKQGLLWREVEADSITGSIETFQKVFVCIEDYRLLFSETLHPSTTENAFLSANIGKSCLGYLALTAQSQVFLKYEKTSNSYSSNSLQRYGFQVKENEEIKLTLFAEEESERSLWIEVINEAIAEVEHELSTKALIIPSFATQNYGPMPDSTSQTSTAVDFPHMEGYLRKTSSGKTLGIKSVKKRWFRLEGGELRYYEDEDVRPSKVRGVFELSAIEVLPPEMENSPFVQIQFPDGGRLMKLTAANGKIAHDWRDALNQTIFVLQQNRTIYNSEFKKARRFNVYDHITDEEKKSLKATVAKTFTSTSSPSSPLPSPPPPSSSSPSPARKSFFGSSPTPPAPPSTPMTPSSKNIRRAESNGFESPIKSYYKSPQLVEMLKSCLVQHFLLKDLLNFNPIIDKLQEKIAVPGEVVIWQGSIGDLFYIIEKGSCEVVKDGKRVAVMSEGKSFGEMALLNSAVRQATIRALRTCRFWCLHRKAFREIIAIQEKQKVEERLQFLKGIELFQKFNDGGLEKIADVMTMKSYQPNDKIIRQGEVGDRFYMIASGRVSVTQQSTFSSTVVELVKLGPNKYFGELALIEDSPRKATVTAITAVTCWTVDRKSFLSLFGSMKEALNESVGVRMLKNVKLLNALSEHQLISVARCLENKAFVEGEVIIRQGDVGDCFYMIASGEVSVQVNHVQVAVLEAGTFFGEMSLLSNEKRSATVIALKDTTCLLLSRTNFNEHLGPLDEVIKAESERRLQMLSITQSGRRRASTSDGLLNRLRTISGSWFQTSTSPTNGSPKRDSLLRSNSLFGMTASMFSLSTLDKIKKLGFGTFGTVYLVQHHDTSKYYAMKEIRKEHLFSTDQEKYLYSEKENLLLLLSSSSSSSNNGSIFFPELYSTFHDPKCVYFIEQYFPSGDLWKCIYSNNLGKTKVGGITVEQARFYAANVLGAIQYMHQHDIIHRDLKPENMMLDASGYLKIVDFGSSKLLPLSDKTRSMVGSPEYLPPEMILCKEYNRSADIWTFGVFIFELLTRMTPYQHNNLVMIYRNIIETEEVLVTQFQQFQGFDSTAKTLISNILQFNLNIRLGMLHNGLQDLWESPFFSGILLEQVERRQIPAPYIPPSQDDADQVDTLEYIDLLEDPDNIPKYTGFFDYSEF